MTDIPSGANAEDCPQCPADVPYPFTCPGHAVAEVEVRPDVPPLPVPALPTRVDDLDSDTYDALRSRYAWLEQRHRDTAHSELAAINVRQAMEIGELKAAIERVRAVHQPAPEEGLGFTENKYGAINPACVCCGTFDEYAVPWPCHTLRVLDDTPEQP